MFYPKFFYQLFFIRAYWNPKSRQGPGLGGLASRGGPEYLNPITTRGADSAHHGRGFPRGYVPLGHSITTWTRRGRAMVSRISTRGVQHRVKFGTRSCWMPLSGILRWIMNIQTRFCKGFFPILMHYTTSICSRISIFMTIRALSLSDHLKLSILLHFAHHNT